MEAIATDSAPAPETPAGWSYKDLAERWRCSVRHVRRLAASGGPLDVFYVGGLPRVTDESRRRVENTRSRPEMAAA